jgi:two-component system chemotaxis response regulator CheB
VSQDLSRAGEPRVAFEIVAVAASAGGVTGVGRLLADLGGEVTVPVVVVQHLDPRHETVIADVLGRRTPLSVKLAEKGERLEAGTVYIAPPDHHLLVGTDGEVTLTQEAAVNFVRPSADLLFESVAESYGDRAIACVLTGTGRDGATGVEAVHARGGTVIVQDPTTADFPGMPEAAVETGVVDRVLPLEDIGAAVCDLIGTKDLQ